MSHLQYLKGDGRLLMVSGHLAKECCCTTCASDGDTPCHDFLVCLDGFQNDCGPSSVHGFPRIFSLNNTDWVALGSPLNISISGVVYAKTGTAGAYPAYSSSGMVEASQMQAVISGLGGTFATYNGTHTLTNTETGPWGGCEWQYSFGGGPTITLHVRSPSGSWAISIYAGTQSGDTCLVTLVNQGDNDGCPITGSYIWNDCSDFCAGTWDDSCDTSESASATVTVL